MNKPYDEQLGIEPSLRLEIINFLNIHKTTTDPTSNNVELIKPREDLDEHELAMAA